MDSGVIYAYGYTALGLVTVVAFLWWNDFDLKDWLKWRKEEAQRSHLWRTVIVPLAVITFLIAIWPVVVVIVAYQYFGEGVGNRRQPSGLQLASGERPSEVRLCDLGTPLSVADLEAKEVVVDPLGAAPAVAFGHLNPAWIKFRKGIAPEDQLQPFDVIWESSRFFTERRTGYARVRGNHILSLFVTQIVGAGSSCYTN